MHLSEVLKVANKEPKTQSLEELFVLRLAMMKEVGVGGWWGYVVPFACGAANIRHQ